jgi:hypothetical protein
VLFMLAPTDAAVITAVLALLTSLTTFIKTTV